MRIFNPTKHLIVLLLAHIIVLFPLSITMFYIFHDNNYTLNEHKQRIRQEWALPLIQDIQVIIPGSACLPGYSELTFGKTDHVNGEYICIETCYDSEGGETCCRSFESIEVNRMFYDNWRSAKYCFKPLLDPSEVKFSYYNSPIYAECPSSLVDCGVIDSAGQHFCASSEVECPIQDIKIIDRTASSSVDYTRINLPANSEENKDLIFRKGNKDGIIVVNLRITQGRPCSLYYERDLPEEAVPVTVETSHFTNECETKILGYHHSPNAYPIDNDFGITLLDNMGFPYQDIYNYPTQRLTQNKDFFLSNSIYVGNKCYDTFKTELYEAVSTEFYADFAHGSFNLSIVIYSVCCSFLLIFWYAISLVYFFANEDSRNSLIFVCNSSQFIFIFPMAVSFVYYGLKMFTQRGDRIISDIMGEDVKNCFTPFDFKNIELIDNESSNYWMFYWQGALFAFYFIQYLNTLVLTWKASVD